MKKLMYEITCSDIRIIELSLQRIQLNKKRLFETKPIRLNSEKLKDWQKKLAKLEKEEEVVLGELNKAYSDLEKLLP